LTYRNHALNSPVVISQLFWWLRRYGKISFSADRCSPATFKAVFGASDVSPWMFVNSACTYFVLFIDS